MDERSALSVRVATRTIDARRPQLTTPIRTCPTDHSLRLRQGQCGVSDPCCGRRRDRRSGQIWWSLTPRYRPDRFAGAVELVRAAKSSARSPGSVSRGVDCSWNKPPARSAAPASLAMSTGLDAAGGEHLARGPVPPTVPPSWMSSSRSHTCLNIPELG